MRASRAALVAAFTFACLGLMTVPTDAGVAWCSEDPILAFSNGTRLQLIVSYDGSYSSALTGAVQWSVQVPVNAGAITVTVPNNAAHPERVTIDYTGGKWGGGTNDLQIHATATVQAVSAFPIMLVVNGDSSTSPMNGTSNKALTIAAHTHTGDFTAYQGVTTGTSYVFAGTGTVTLP